MAWHKGPLPPGTWMWGAIVPKGLEGEGFYFADFMGDHVITYPGEKRVEAADVVYYTNDIEMPPHPTAQKRAGTKK
jgi:hypothetical protein